MKQFQNRTAFLACENDNAKYCAVSRTEFHLKREILGMKLLGAEPRSKTCTNEKIEEKAAQGVSYSFILEKKAKQIMPDTSSIRKRAACTAIVPYLRYHSSLSP